METWTAIRSRRNIRAYEDREIPHAHLDQILEAGRRAPSARNRQPWDFVVVTDREQLTELSKVWEGAGHVAHSAATITLIAPISQDRRQSDQRLYDLGQTTMLMMLAAVDLGIGSGHSSVSDQQRARRILAFPDDRFCAYMIALGYPADRPLTPIRQPARRPFEDVVHRARW